MFTKANQIAMRPKTEMLFEKETQKKTQHKQSKISCLNTRCPHVLCWLLLYINKYVFYGSMLQNKAYCLLLSLGVICYTYVIFHDATWRVFVTEAAPLASEIVQSNVQHNSHKVSRPILPCRPTSALYCIVTHFTEMIVCLWWWDPAQHYPLHLAIVHYCTQCGPVSEAISW